MLNRIGTARAATRALTLAIVGLHSLRMLAEDGPGSVGAGAPAAPKVPGPATYNLILIDLTNTRADHLGLYGYSRNTSPNLDRFAKQCLVFRNAFSHASWTLPAAVSLFTSQYPFTHGLMNREDFTPLPNATPTFIDVLRSNGWFTAAFVGDRDYSQRFGHTSRFDFVFDAVNPGAHEDWRTYGVLEQTLPAAREWLRRNRDRRFCVLIQGYDTHCPFAVPKADARFDPDYRGDVDFTKCYWTFERTRPIKLRSRSGDYEEVYLLKTRPQGGEDSEVMFHPDDVRHMIALYDGEIVNADAQIGRLLDEVDALGLANRTIVVFYSDHGDMFGKHGRFMRGGPLRGTFYDDVLRIPLLVRHPGYGARSIDGLAQLIDLGPTLLEMTGCPVPGTFAGKSLLPLVARDSEVNPLVFAGAAFTPSGRNPLFYHHSVILSARSREWKLIVERVSYSVGPQDYFELYDLSKDREELVNLADQRETELRKMKLALRQWLAGIKSAQYWPETK